MPSITENMDNWTAVFDLLLFRQLRDDVDDTLVQKLVSSLDTCVRDKQGFALALWEHCGILSKLEKAVAVPRTSESLCFALHVIATFGKLESLFTSLRDASRVLRALKRSVDNPANASERAAYASVMTSFLHHAPGQSWCLENDISSRMFHWLQDPSIFVQGIAEAYFVTLLESDLKGDGCHQTESFLSQALAEELSPTQRKNCLRVLCSVLDKDSRYADKLCSKFNLRRHLLESCATWMPLPEAVSRAAAGVLAALSTSASDESFFQEVVATLGEDKLVVVKFASCFTEQRRRAHSQTSQETEWEIAKVLTELLTTNGPQSADRSKARAVQSAAICELQRALPHFSYPATYKMVADKVVEFLQHSSAAKVPRLLSVALECFALCVSKMDLTKADPSKLAGYLTSLAPVLRDPNVSAHVLKEALVTSVTLACSVFSNGGPGFDWRECGALLSLGESLQRHLVSTEPYFAEVALDAVGGVSDTVDALKLVEGTAGLSCLVDWLQHYGLACFTWDNLRNGDGGVRASAASAVGKLFVRDWLWTHFSCRLTLSEADAVRAVMSVALDDADVFARRAASATLRLWLDRDRLGLRSKQRQALQRCASNMLALDLDCEIQMVGLSLWKTLLGECLDGRSSVGNASIKDVLEEADTAGFGASVKKAVAVEADREVRKEACQFLTELHTRLQGELLRSCSSACVETTSTAGKVHPPTGAGDSAGFDGNATPMECNDAIPEEGYSAALEEVLDLNISECLQRKLKPPEEIGKAAAAFFNTERLLLEPTVCTTSLLAEVAVSPGFREEAGAEECSFERCCASILEDLLAAAASEHCDRDCY